MSDVTYPVPVSGRISEATNKLVLQAKKANALLSTGTLVRMAMEDFIPRYVAKDGRTLDARLMAEIATSLRVNPALRDVYLKTAKEGKRQKAA